VLLNWVTTGDHLLRTVGTYWPVAGVDLVLLAAAAVAFAAARHLRQRAAVMAVRADAAVDGRVEVSRA
jgi:hypothetical protein